VSPPAGPGLRWEEVPHTGWDPAPATGWMAPPGPTLRRAAVPGGWFVLVSFDQSPASTRGWFYPDPDHRWLAVEP
jgi:hypothetical protein